MDYSQRYQTSFNHYPKQRPLSLLRPENYLALEAAVANAACTVRGLGRSYGDAPLSRKGQLILMERLDRFLAFDEQQGILCIEAGISLDKILELVVGRGWFLPVTPGTSRATLGGCIAADVHGKNHRVAGSVGQHVLALELIDARGKRISCSPEIQSELFWATVGGMGLTGIIISVTLKLKPIASARMFVEYRTNDDLEASFNSLGQEDPEREYEVAWLDGLGTPLGRGVTRYARHAEASDLPREQRSKPFESTVLKASYTVPFYLPKGFLHPALIKIFNGYHYWRMAGRRDSRLLGYRDYFYPLDRIVHWPRLYGRCGFLQYQCALPVKSAYLTTQRILERLATQGHPIYLAVLKRLGRESLAPLSFALPGFTLALDLPLGDPALFICLNHLDALVLEAGGRVYLAKDARLGSSTFRNMYPRYREWLAVKQRWDPENRFNSSLAERLEIIPSAAG